MSQLQVKRPAVLLVRLTNGANYRLAFFNVTNNLQFHSNLSMPALKALELMTSCAQSEKNLANPRNIRTRHNVWTRQMS